MYHNGTLKRLIVNIKNSINRKKFNVYNINIYWGGANHYWKSYFISLRSTLGLERWLSSIIYSKGEITPYWEGTIVVKCADIPILMNCFNSSARFNNPTSCLVIRSLFSIIRVAFVRMFASSKHAKRSTLTLKSPNCQIMSKLLDIGVPVVFSQSSICQMHIQDIDREKWGFVGLAFANLH